MPKKNFHNHTGGQSLGDISQRGETKRYSQYQSKKKYDAGGLHPKIEGKSPHPCNHCNLMLVKLGENTYKCSNEICGKLFGAKEIKSQ